ncbi:MAG: HTH domain-containing protein [Bryobacteraceae bacterium]
MSRTNASQHKLVRRECPVCGKLKTFPARQPTCGYECGYKLRLRRMEEAKRETRDQSSEQDVLAVLKRARTRLSIRDISERVNRSEKTVREALESLRTGGHNVEIIADGEATLSTEVRPNASEPLIVHSMQDYRNGFRVFGATSDNHLGSKHERLDVLNALYDLYAAEGVTEVFNAGNWIEGEAGKMNFHDIKVFGLDDQVDYWIENYPQRKGITTHFIAGDDHEGWYQKRERIEIGKYAMLRARAAGREDLNYLGYLEADVELRAAEGSRWMKVMHPGGGSAYALSYAPQKLVESFQGGEKPSALLIGHYHKFDFNYSREVFCVQTGCTCDQSVFMRKQKIQAHVGGCLIRINQATNGTINRFQVEWVPFYDRGFYQSGARRF